MAVEDLLQLHHIAGVLQSVLTAANVTTCQILRITASAQPSHSMQRENVVGAMTAIRLPQL